MTTEIERSTPAPVTVPSRIGQGTAIEQSRAAAEVLAAIQVAQMCPRDITQAIAEMTQSCQQIELAERAFYRYNRGGSQVSGPSVHLARELARCFRNVQYGMAELRRDDEFGQSEMQAYAWDVENNTRAANIFIVPHKRDRKDGAVALVELRDIYENNANNASRRLRQQIFAILPPWFVQQAVTLCTQTLESGGGDEPLQQRIAKAIDAYSKRGVTKAQLEQKLARKAADWTAPDLATLLVVIQSIGRGEVTVADEFPQERVTAAELTAPAKARGAKKTEEDLTAAQGFGEPLPVEDPPGGAE